MTAEKPSEGAVKAAKTVKSMFTGALDFASLDGYLMPLNLEAAAVIDREAVAPAVRDLLKAAEILSLEMKILKDDFEEEADAEYFPDSAAPVGNDAMRRYCALDSALLRAECFIRPYRHLIEGEGS